MHAVEEATIGQLYDKARYHKIHIRDKGKKFYYTRANGGRFENLSEMMGSRNVLRWLLPVPYYNRQYHKLIGGGGDDDIPRDMEYMMFDKETLKELVSLEYIIEKKVEDDLLSSGFKIKNRIQIPKHLSRMIGKIE